MEVRSLAFRTDLMVRRLAGSIIVDKGHYLVVRTPVRPWYRWGNFLLLDAPPVGEAIETWIDVFHAEFPGAGHVALGIDGTEFREPLGFPSSVGLEADPFGVVLTARRPPGPRTAAGEPVIRPLHSAEDWREELKLRRDESAEDGPPPPHHAEFLQGGTLEASRLVDQGRAAYFGAFEGDRLCSVVGIASDGRGVARYQNVATRTEYRRRGLASRLVSEAGSFAVSTMGAGQLVIVADVGAPSARLYESLGFDPVETHLGLSVSIPPVEGPRRVDERHPVEGSPNGSENGTLDWGSS